MGLKKQLKEIRAADGLSQKFDPRSLPGDKSASAVNLVKNKQGRLEKRLGVYPLPGADPFGSGFSLSTGLGLGTWNDGANDNLVIVGRGNRPGTAALATALQTYSDDLSGPTLRGPMPELSVVSDTASAGSPGAVTNPMTAVSGDYALSAWIEVSPPLPPLPAPPNGFLVWQLTQISTGQVIAGPAAVDSTATGSSVQCARLDVIGNVFVLAYSRASAPPDLNIYARIVALSTLLAGGTWQPSPPNAPVSIVNNNVALNGAFAMRSANDGTTFALAYEAGTWGPVGGYQPTAVLVTSFTAATLAAGSTWTVQAAGTRVSGFGIRVNHATGHVVVCYSLPSGTYSYQVFAAVGAYPALTQVNTPTVIYTPTSTIASNAPETSPFFIDVSFCPGNAQGHENYVASHSPAGSVWNAANVPAAAAKVGGTGAKATCNIQGSVGSVTLKSGGSYVSVGSLTMDVTGANGSGVNLSAWSLQGGGNQPPFIYINGAGTTVVALDPPQSFTTASGATASLTKTGTTIAATGLSGISPAMVGSQITITGAATPGNNGTFTIVGTTSSTTASWINASGATDAHNGAISWSIPAVPGGAGFQYPLTATFSGGQPSSPAIATATIDGGIATGLFTITDPGNGYTSVPTVTFTPVDGNGTGAAATAIIVSEQVIALGVTASGSGYTQPPTISIAYPTSTVTPLMQSMPCRVISQVNQATLHPENNARILNNMFFVNTTLGGAVNRYNPTDGFGYCCGDGTGPGGSYAAHALSCITPGVVLASGGLEANGVVYMLGWVPSQTDGTFIVFAFDLAPNPIVNGAGALTGNGWPMRPVAALQTRSALADPGGGLQTSTLPGGPTMGPNMWTGGSSWFLGADDYATAYVSYISSSIGQRLSLVTGSIQTAPRQPPQIAQWGSLAAISGAIPTVFDGHSVFEIGFLWSPGSIVAIGTLVGSPILGGGLDFLAATDSYTWIFTWEQFDDQGGLHTSARSTPVTITGQDLLDAGVLAPYQLAQGASVSFQFMVPALGATMRQIPSPIGSVAGANPLGNDLRAFCAIPTSAPSLGAYRTQNKQPVFYRIYDRSFNGADAGGASFTLPALVTNTFNSALGNTTPSLNQVGTVSITDTLNDSVIARINTQGIQPFPLLYGDGTDGLPGNADAYCPPASDIMVAHKGRLFVARGNQLLYSKVSSSGTAPGFNEVLFSVDAGGDDPIVWGASMDDRFVIGKSTSNHYISGNGPADDGSGNSYGQAQPIPTDLGCTSPRSVISTPEGIYYQSGAGLRMVDRGLNVRFIGGPPEDELLSYPVVLGAALHPQANRVLLLAAQSDVPSNITSQTVGEILTRDYALDAWTTALVSNAGVQTGFVSAAVAWAQGPVNTGTGKRPPYKPTLHLLGADGVVWREHGANDQLAYFDNNTYVSWTWTSAPILAPVDDKGTTSLSARFRCWDIILTGVSQDPHGLNVGVGLDGGAIGSSRAWMWNNGTSQGSIAPGGVIPTPLTKLRTYDGRMGSQFQIQVQDVSDPNSTTGAGMQFLGLTCALGVMPGPYKLPSSATQ